MRSLLIACCLVVSLSVVNCGYGMIHYTYPDGRTRHSGPNKNGNRHDGTMVSPSITFREFPRGLEHRSDQSAFIPVGDEYDGDDMSSRVYSNMMFDAQPMYDDIEPEVMVVPARRTREYRRPSRLMGCGYYPC